MKQEAPKQHRPVPDGDLHVGDIAIDTGRLIMCDPCRAEEVAAQANESDEQGAHQYTKVFGEKLVMGVGVNVPTGLGDGIYPVIAHYETLEGIGRRLFSIYIPFGNGMRGSGCPVGRDWPHKLSKACFRSVDPEKEKANGNNGHTS
jgi:hypothetical protein